jgi:hypothetical protein
MDNPETLAKSGTQDTGQINVREYRVLCLVCLIFQCLWVVHS